MRVLVVLPTYNEAANIVRILEAVRVALPEANVLVVDDSSPDSTSKLALEAAERLGQVDVVVRPEKNGLGQAYRAGFAWGLERGYDALVEMDSDFSHDPAALPSLVAPLGDGVELTIGSRYVPGGEIPDWSFSRRMISRGGNLYAKVLLGLGVEDSTAGFRAYAASLLRRIDLASVRADSYGFQVEMTYLSMRAGAEIREVPIRFVDRKEGVSKMSGHTVSEALALVTTLGAKRLLRPSLRRESAPSTASRV
ncbi:MAG TPA: polyprenol monophosphomannose synthase [Acidimicrobiales bacterium]|nr:polyprenol monophosphomannose synthase [Acidimicrobiales bacterium]